MNEKYDERKVYAAEIVEELVEMRFKKLQSMYIDDHSSSRMVSAQYWKDSLRCSR